MLTVFFKIKLNKCPIQSVRLSGNEISSNIYHLCSGFDSPFRRRELRKVRFRAPWVRSQSFPWREHSLIFAFVSRTELSAARVDSPHSVCSYLEGREETQISQSIGRGQEVHIYIFNCRSSTLIQGRGLYSARTDTDYSS